MRNSLMMNRRKKEENFARSEMTNIDEVYYVKNVIMKVI
jgi:hypothetical protein